MQGVLEVGGRELAASPLHLFQERKREHLCRGRPRGVPAPRGNRGDIPTPAPRVPGHAPSGGPSLARAGRFLHF